jgi:cephalosporin hydroxylase
MARLFLKGYRYFKTYGELIFGRRPRTPAEAIDYCIDRPVMMAQVRSEIEELAKLIQAAAPKCSLEIGTNYGGTLFLLCTLSPPGARVISVDLPAGQFGGGYPRRKIPLYRRFPRNGQQLHLIRGDSHAPETLARVERLLAGDKIDYLFIDGDHTYQGVKSDFEMYKPFVRSGGMIAFHDIAVHTKDQSCKVDRFWNEIKQRYQHREFIEDPKQGWAGIGVLFVS